jgi:hypothetical protein
MSQPGPRTEIRTRRLVIADDHDRPRIVAEVVNGVAEVRVTTTDPETYVLIYAGPVAQVQAWADGDRWRSKLTVEE